MPAETALHAPLFAERLSIPRRWWLIALVGVLVAGAEVFGGFPWWVAAVVYAGLGLPVLALLLGMGRTRVRVDDDGLHAQGKTLPATDIAGATILDAQQTRLRLGPGADPRAHVVARGFIKQSVEVTPLDERDVPYWLVSTRRPDELVEALRAAVVWARD
ncbi:MAG TPA: DUF3093 domain-containing protein [Mycobacteriales bacterium]|nr:DUF3093 domain-containing protein [Mycobacteriales bacterium]